MGKATLTFKDKNENVLTEHVFETIDSTPQAEKIIKETPITWAFTKKVVVT